MEKKVIRREPLTAENEVRFSVTDRYRRKSRVREFANTPGHVHSLLQAGKDIEILEGRDRYVAWCEDNDQAPLLTREG